jgi:hypothetical protein
MDNKATEHAMIKISVTTAGGIVPIDGATVIVSYKTFPGLCDCGKQTKHTDSNGEAGVFRIPIKRAFVGNRRVDFPCRAECDVEVIAEGYVIFKARSVQLFPEITVVSSFDLLPLNNRLDVAVRHSFDA